MGKRIEFEYRSGDLWIKCPACKTEQILPENDKRQARGKDGYTIDRNGYVSPVWVCMARPNGVYCHAEYSLELKDY